MSSEKRTLRGDRVDQSRDRPRSRRRCRPCPGRPRAASRSSSRIDSASDGGRVEAEVHRRRAGVVAAAVDDDVRVHVAGDRGHEPDPVAGVLEHARLLDVHLDPAGQVVEDVRALPPALGLVTGVGGVLPEAPPVVDRAEALAQVLLGDALGDDPAAEQHLPEAGALLLEERDQLERQVEALLLVQAADLERRDDAHRPVVFPTVSVGVAVRADAEDRLALRPVARGERADRVLLDVEPERLELAREVVERAAVGVRVRVAADRLVRERVVRAGERLDVALDALRAPSLSIAGL